MCRADSRSRATNTGRLPATFTTFPSESQLGAFQQWFKVDLAQGALPFLIDLWLYNSFQRVRARFVGTYKAQCVGPKAWQMSGAFEIERQGIGVYLPDLPALRP